MRRSHDLGEGGIGHGQGQLVVLEGVYPPSEDTFLLIDAVEAVPSVGEVLELCCGTGAVGLSIAPRARRIVAVDLNPLAVRNTVLNYRKMGLEEKLDAIAGDLFSPLSAGHYDLVIMNPPYLADGVDPRDMAWSGGEGGRAVIDRFLDGVGGHLGEGGRAVFIQSDLNGLQETLDRAKANGLSARVIGERTFRFEALLAMEVRRPSEGQKD